MTRAEELLTEFYKLFPQIYNKGSCGHNIGSHLTYFVRKWGPLWAWSCFFLLLPSDLRGAPIPYY